MAKLRQIRLSNFNERRGAQDKNDSPPLYKVVLTSVRCSRWPDILCLCCVRCLRCNHNRFCDRIVIVQLQKVGEPKADAKVEDPKKKKIDALRVSTSDNNS